VVVKSEIPNGSCIECLPSRVPFPTEAHQSRMLYAEDVGGPGQAPT
jgi:hypothetical protein